MAANPATLIYGDVDLNLIDGSAVWLASVAEILSLDESLAVSVLLKCPLKDSTVVAGLAGRLRLIDPWRQASSDPAWQTALAPLGSRRRLTPAVAARVIELAWQTDRFDLLFVRADAERHLLPRELARRRIVPTCRQAWVYVTNTAQLETEDLQELLENYRRVLCQTPQALEDIVAKLPAAPRDKLLVLPPMIPPCVPQKPRAQHNGICRLCYTGKFSREYYPNELLDAFERLRKLEPEIELHLVGDKFHNYQEAPGFEAFLRYRMQNTPGVTWHGRKTREETQRIVADCHLAVSWRHRQFDSSLELSTKVLESAALGVPVLMNRAATQVELFGEDYPLYVDSQTELIEKVLLVHRDRNLYGTISNEVAAKASPFTYPSLRERLRPALQEDICLGKELA